MSKQRPKMDPIIRASLLFNPDVDLQLQLKCRKALKEFLYNRDRKMVPTPPYFPNLGPSINIPDVLKKIQHLTVSEDSTPPAFYEPSIHRILKDCAPDGRLLYEHLHPGFQRFIDFASPSHNRWVPTVKLLPHDFLELFMDHPFKFMKAYWPEYYIRAELALHEKGNVVIFCLEHCPSYRLQSNRVFDRDERQEVIIRKKSYKLVFHIHTLTRLAQRVDGEENPCTFSYSDKIITTELIRRSTNNRLVLGDQFYLPIYFPDGVCIGVCPLQFRKDIAVAVTFLPKEWPQCSKLTLENRSPQFIFNPRARKIRAAPQDRLDDLLKCQYIPFPNGEILLPIS